VLGQYDLALLSAEAAPGQLLFVEENIRATAASLGVDVAAFRTWIALHETTHAFEFEAHPWLRPYLAERLERQLVAFARSTSSLGADAGRAVGRALRGGDGHWLERLMSDEQRTLFRETQAVMSLLEGFGDHVMDSVGRDLVPGVVTISARFHARRASRTSMERAILRVTGLDLKMEQYARGERFVAGIERIGGPVALRRLWEGPETLPRDTELEHPERWARRVLGKVA
ncbi:MAG: zinc-dependent metalloprotease, partial [Thermoplasmata archaeon]|nr:zinc-dependent metalloprotease [Thermoplasmata archaeon]